MEQLRRALLKPEFAELYPELKAGIWLDALHTSIKRAERLWHEQGSPAPATGRVLPDEHFRFAGGKPRRRRSSKFSDRISDDPSTPVLRLVSDDFGSAKGWVGLTPSR